MPYFRQIKKKFIHISVINFTCESSKCSYYSVLEIFLTLPVTSNVFKVTVTNQYLIANGFFSYSFFQNGPSLIAMSHIQCRLFPQMLTLQIFHLLLSLGIKPPWSSEQQVGSSALAPPLANISSVYYLFWAPLETHLRTLPVGGQYMWNR